MIATAFLVVVLLGAATLIFWFVLVGGAAVYRWAQRFTPRGRREQELLREWSATHRARNGGSD